MNYNEWVFYYKKIVRDFHFDPDKDYLSSTMLSTIIGNNYIKKEIIQDIIEKREVVIVGDAPYSPFQKSILNNRVIIAADDAAGFLMENGIVPDIVLTDLDAKKEIIYSVSDAGSIIGVHAHGDNMERLEIARDLKNVFGTTQNKPLWNVYNFGGFTDGDRCVFLAHHFNAKRIILTRFDFYHPNERKGKNLEIKIKKLSWANYLINVLKIKYGANILIL